MSGKESERFKRNLKLKFEILFRIRKSILTFAPHLKRQGYVKSM